MENLIENLTKQLQKVMTEHPDEVETDTYWRGVRIGLETAIEVARELDHDDKTCKCPLCTGNEMEDDKTYKCTNGNSECYIGRGGFISPNQVIDVLEDLSNEN